MLRSVLTILVVYIDRHLNLHEFSGR